MRVWLILLVIVVSGSGAELLQNGDFELAPVAENGWVFESWGAFPDTGNCRLRWAHSFIPDRDFETSLLKTLEGSTRITQAVAVPTLDLGFSVECSLAAWTTSDPLYAAACITVEFLDRADSVLGETRLVRATSGCDWQSGPALHIVRLPDTAWCRRTLSIAAELAALPAVSPTSVKSLRVGVLAYVHGNS